MTSTTEAILRSVLQLPDEELREFTEQVLRLDAERRSYSLPAGESDLLARIQEPIHRDTRARYGELVRKRDEEALSPQEHRELCELSELVEQRNAERMTHAVELASRRGVSLSELLEQLDLGPLVSSP